MSEKKLTTRIQQKADTKANWDKATNFVPLKGEYIYYSDLHKVKVGDGVTKVGSLPFLADSDTHQSIKALNTNNTSAQTVSSSEAIAGSGTINLHKVAKTGSYNDLNNKPTIPSKLSQMTNDANYVKSTDNIDADTLAGKTYSQITGMIDQKQRSTAFLGLIADTDISNNKTGFLRVYMKPIEAPGTTHYTRVAELQNLPLASSSEYGMVKLGSDAQQSTAANSVSSTASRTYAIQKDSSGKLVVNVPWVLSSYTLPDAGYSTKGGVKAIFGATSGGEGNFELYADIQQGSNTLYIRAGQFKQTSGSESSATRFTFKRAMSSMGGAAGYVAVILGDSYGQTTNGQWMGSLAVDGADYGGFKYRASNSEKGHVYYIAIGRY